MPYPWTSAVNDLRTLLSDGPEDRYNSKKRCFGDVNGTNPNFKTFEFRRITDFTTAVFPLGIFIDNVPVDPAKVSADFISTGDFVLDATVIPLNGSAVEASYYSQWFLDSELSEFLVVASNWLLSSDDFTLIGNGLQPSALKYAAAEAYLKMAMRWKTFLSENYRVEDEPHKPGTGPSAEYMEMSKTFRAEALASRNEFYTRQGQNLQPLFGSVLGNVPRLPGGA